MYMRGFFMDDTHVNSRTMEYARSAAWYRRSRYRRLGAGILAAVTVCWLVHFSHQCIEHWRYLRLQNDCMEFLAPPTSYLWDFQTIAHINTPPLVSIQLSSPLEPGAETMSSHRFRRPGGPWRLVSIHCYFTASDLGTPGLALEGRAWIPATWGIYSRAKPASQQQPVALYVSVHRLFALQPDPTDESHFTIRYQFLSGDSGTIDGWLMPDDTVKIEPRDGHLRRVFEGESEIPPRKKVDASSQPMPAPGR